MTTEATASGSSAAAETSMSAAERLMKQHAEEESHKAYVEDAVDEETMLHPPPSGAASLPISNDPSRVATPSHEPSMSARAAEKQPMREQPQPKESSKPALDTQSEDAFPALGPAKAQSASAAATSWSKKPAAVKKAVNGTGTTSNGITNGNKAVPSKTSNVPKSASGYTSPESGANSQRGPVPQMMLPGRASEFIQLLPSEMTPRAQLKKPVTDILRDINKRSKANVEMKAGPGGVLKFEGTGPVDAVRVALKEVATQLCSKRTATVAVPASVRGKIVGKQGATIQAISKRTGARINISKQDAAEILEDDDMDTTVDVTIEGDPFAVEIARQDIEKIVNEHTSSVSTRLKHIPPEYYPFLAGPNNARANAMQDGRDLRMQIPNYYNWKQQAPPQMPVNRQPATFAAQPDLPIFLTGERQAVNEVKAELERQFAELQRQLTLEQMAIERGRHQFIVGDLGTSLHDFMQETGCSVILPPDGDDSEMLTVVGPPDRIEEGLNKVMDLASSMSMASADIARQHANAPNGAQAHARDITRYLQQRDAIAQLERMHNARIVPDSSGAWQIYARDGKNAMKARSDVMNLISGHPPTRFQPVQVDPFYHQHLREQGAQQIRDRHGVQMIVPDAHDGSPVLLVFEDAAPSTDYQLPRRQPTAQDAQAFQKALQDAQREVLGLISGREEIVSRDVDAPVKFHDKIRKHTDRHHQGLPEGSIPLQMMYGGPRAPQQPRRAPAPTVNVRGPQNDVDAFMKNLLAFIAQEEQDELERGFTLSFDFPQKFASHLIGKGGDNINRIRDDFDVDVNLNEGKCEIKGPEAKANACKKHILDMVKKLEDEAEHHLNIPNQFHRDLIGHSGTQVTRLQDRYGVRINFPRAKQAEIAGSEATGAASGRSNNQLPHEVIIKGPSKGADACRDELLSLLQYVKDNSHSAVVSVAQNQLPSLIGAGGKEMEAMRLETGAQIDVPSSRDAASPNGRAEIKIKGSKKAVEDAKKLIEEKARVFDNTVTRSLDVDRKYHGQIIGPQGSNLRNLILQAGGPDDARLQKRMIRFPRADTNEGNTIRIEAQKSVADQLHDIIQALVAEQESQTTDIAEVKPDKHRLLIGRGGETRRHLEQQFGVSINIPRQNETGPQRSQVRITGQPPKVEQAKAHILEITKDQEGETIPVPRAFHHTIADNGQFFRRLRNDHKVTVDHNGQRPPPKPATPTPTRANGASAPLITDDPSATADSHHWESHSLHGSSTEDGDIPWVLSGSSPEAVSAARAKLERALEEAKKQDTVGFLILPDPRAYRHVIGPGGTEINRIRRQTGTKIQVPRDQTKGEAIEITGTEAGVVDARDVILDIVRNNSS